MPAALPNVRSGRTRALATTGKNRTPILPDAPTVAESGLPGYEFTTWWGVAAPAGTPQPVISKLNTEIIRIMARPDIKELVLAQGAESRTSSPQEFMDHIRAQIDFFSRIVADAGIKPE
jgi:tripartite-type tricarboxylate transporter receptor subunit TctC